ncbi:MAG TPA: hypothetical protein VIV06_10840 [Candidatus Limnocylindrales bacterium]
MAPTNLRELSDEQLVEANRKLMEQREAAVRPIVVKQLAIAVEIDRRAARAKFGTTPGEVAAMREILAEYEAAQAAAAEEEPTDG